MEKKTYKAIPDGMNFTHLGGLRRTRGERDLMRERTLKRPPKRSIKVEE